MVVAAGGLQLPRLLRRPAGAQIDQLYRRYADEVFRYSLTVLRSRADAEDVVQTVFVRALRALDRGERVAKPHNWLIKIAHNECRRLLASRKVHAELPEELAAEPAERGQAEELRGALDALPAQQRQALVLRELEGRPYAEIAARLDLSVSAVETLLFRARRALREQLEGAMGCDEFALLLDDPDADRARLRAHARVCEPCAHLERQARGRKSRLGRIASTLFPWWGTGAKVAAVAIGTATLAGGGVAVADPPHRHHQHSSPMMNTVSGAAGTGLATVTHRSRRAPQAKVSDTVTVSDTRPVAAAPVLRLPRHGAERVATQPTPTTPVAAPTATPTAPAAAPTSAPAPAATTPGSVPTVTTTPPAVTTTPEPPQVTTPAVTVPTPVPTVSVPTETVTVPTVTVTTPEVTVNPVTTPVATTPAVTVPSVTIPTPPLPVPVPNVSLP